MINLKKLTVTILGVGVIAAAAFVLYQKCFNKPFRETLIPIAAMIKNAEFSKAQDLISKIDIKNNKITPKERAEILLYKTQAEMQLFLQSAAAKDISGLTRINNLKNQLKFARAILIPDLSPKFIELNTQFQQLESLIMKTEHELVNLSNQQNLHFQNMYNNMKPMGK